MHLFVHAPVQWHVNMTARWRAHSERRFGKSHLKEIGRQLVPMRFAAVGGGFRSLNSRHVFSRAQLPESWRPDPHEPCRSAKTPECGGCKSILPVALWWNGPITDCFFAWTHVKVRFPQFQQVDKESGLAWGGGVVKVLILQFFRHMERVCKWSHKSRLSRILHFLQRCCLLPKMFYFLFSILEKKTWLYIMILMPAMNSALYCCIYYRTYIYINTYIYTLFDKIVVFSQ